MKETCIFFYVGLVVLEKKSSINGKVDVPSFKGPQWCCLSDEETKQTCIKACQVGSNKKVILYVLK